MTTLSRQRSSHCSRRNQARTQGPSYKCCKARNEAGFVFGASVAANQTDPDPPSGGWPFSLLFPEPPKNPHQTFTAAALSQGCFSLPGPFGSVCKRFGLSPRRGSYWPLAGAGTGAAGPPSTGEPPRGAPQPRGLANHGAEPPGSRAQAARESFKAGDTRQFGVPGATPERGKGTGPYCWCSVRARFLGLGIRGRSGNIMRCGVDHRAKPPGPRSVPWSPASEKPRAMITGLRTAHGRCPGRPGPPTARGS